MDPPNPILIIKAPIFVFLLGPFLGLRIRGGTLGISTLSIRSLFKRATSRIKKGPLLKGSP